MRQVHRATNYVARCHGVYNNFAAAFAKYVRMKSAPARRMDVSVSSMIRSPSIQPFCAAAMIIENSPLT